MTINGTLKNLFSRQFFLLKNKLSKPREVAIEITYRCNLDCPTCFNKFSKNINGCHELDYYCIKEIISNISKFGIKIIRFSGGEPLIREDIFDLMIFAKSKGLEIWLNTNATLINQENAYKLSKLVDSVLIPLNSFDRQTELLSTKKNLFEAKLSGIKLLKEANIKILRIGTITTKINIKNLERIYGLVERLGINNWELFRPIPVPNDVNLFPIDNSDVALLIEKLTEINKKNGKNFKIFNAIPFCSYEPEKVAKVAAGGKYDDGHTRLIIDTQGTVKPMYYLAENIGNALTCKDFRHFWNNKFMKNIRNLNFCPDVCKKCKILNVCLGGSRAVSKLVNKSYIGFDYLAQPLKYESQLFYK